MKPWLWTVVCCVATGMCCLAGGVFCGTQAQHRMTNISANTTEISLHAAECNVTIQKGRPDVELPAQTTPTLSQNWLSETEPVEIIVTVPDAAFLQLLHTLQ